GPFNGNRPRARHCSQFAEPGIELRNVERENLVGLVRSNAERRELEGRLTLVSDLVETGAAVAVPQKGAESNVKLSLLEFVQHALREGSTRQHGLLFRPLEMLLLLRRALPLVFRDAGMMVDEKAFNDIANAAWAVDRAAG